MPAAAEVRPEKWTEIRVLFDDGEYSVISGLYERGPHRSLGERWNGDAGSPIGFPNVAGYPIWHVVPQFLQLHVLHGLLDALSAHPSPNSGEYVRAILDELQRVNQSRPMP
jgi:hypothetical protein